MKKVICDFALHCLMKNECGAAVPHWDVSCEPCPREPEAKCVPATLTRINYGAAGPGKPGKRAWVNGYVMIEGGMNNTKVRDIINEKLRAENPEFVLQGYCEVEGSI